MIAIFPDFAAAADIRALCHERADIHIFDGKPLSAARPRCCSRARHREELEAAAMAGQRSAILILRASP